jgi:hypothetical protein
MDQNLTLPVLGFLSPLTVHLATYVKTNFSQTQRHSLVTKISSQCFEVTGSTLGPKSGQVFCGFSELPQLKTTIISFSLTQLS